MTTLTKALNDASRPVRLRAADALRQLVTIQIKFPHFILQLIIDSGHHINVITVSPTEPEVVGWFVV